MSDIVYSIDDLKKKLSEILKEEPVYQVILFGSYAKNEADSNSDIDILIDTKSTLRGFAFLSLVCMIEEKLQKKIDGFEKYQIIENSKIDNEIKNTGVVIYEK